MQLNNNSNNMDNFYNIIKKDFLSFNLKTTKKNEPNNEINNNLEENSNNNNYNINNSFLFLLPNEIISNILSILPVRDIVSLSIVNNHFYNLINNYNNLWKNLYFKVFKSNFLNLIHSEKGNNNNNYNNRVAININKTDSEFHHSYNNNNNYNNNKLKKYKDFQNWKNKFMNNSRVENNWLNQRYTTYSLDTNIGGVFCLSQKKSMLITGSFDSSLKLWKIIKSRIKDDETLGENTDDNNIEFQYNRTKVSIEPILNIKGHDGWIWSTHLKQSKNYHKTKCISSSQDGSILISEFDNDNFNNSTSSTGSINIKSLRKSSNNKKSQISTEYASGGGCSSYDLNIVNEGTFLKGHKGTVWTTLPDTSLNFVYSGGSDSLIKKWNIDRMEFVGDIGKHNESVLCLSGISYEHPNLLASGSADHSIKLWDIRMPPSLHKGLVLSINEHGVNINCLSLSNHYIISGSDDGKIRVCDIRYIITSPRPHVISEIKAHDSSIRALSIKRNRLVTSSTDIKIWNTSSLLKPTKTLVGHRGSVISMQLNNNNIITGSLDSTVKFWNYD